ncbi:GNAT family N-acetyltransferase [Pacificimonas flava]|uniref:GCN5-related N-acetyltransferase n=1 Tax=Pacificimonas flava TaxID=1234595 RepID=M2U7A4_9SPHN|nr:GNAT family N-acetyltransferase [Pacificimonas flava]EMD83873.1 GCN5-related N-acetyltransferase [Pacificimonas flava]MBB5281151.1 putative acetyltransferase [Pacificimonas flava]
MIIREYREGDAAGLTKLVRTSITVLGTRDYDEEQLRTWAARFSDDTPLKKRLGDGRLVLVAETEGGQPAAFIDLEADGHIDFLYASPAAAGSGAVEALYRALEERARMAAHSRLYTEASEMARRFFKRRGFRVLGRRDFDMDGVPMHNFAMEKRLG